MKKQVYNPYLPSFEYVPDGEPHVFGILPEAPEDLNPKRKYRCKQVMKTLNE